MENLVESATSDVRQGTVDYGVNMEICDAVERSPAEAHAMVTAARKRLLKSDPHVQALALTLLEMCVKNADNAHAAVQDVALETVARLCEASSTQPGVRTQALALVQQWGVAFEPLKASYPRYAETYEALRVKGCSFGPVPDDVPVFTPPASGVSTNVPDDASFAAALADGTIERANALAKVRADLDVVAEHVALLQDMIPNSPGIDAGDEAMAEVVGFLEACRPRLAALVEAGLAGDLGDETLTHCLAVNDAVHKALQDEASGNTYAAPSLPAPPAAPLALDADDDPPLAPPAPPGGDLLDLGMPAAAPAPAAPTSLLDMDFAQSPAV